MTRNQYSLLLWLFCIISPFALMPFESAITRFVGIASPVRTPWGLIFAGFEAAIIYGLMVFYGMRWATAIGSRFLLLETNIHVTRDILKPGLIWGIVCAAAVLLADVWLPASPLNLFAFASSVPPVIGFFGLFFCIVNQQVFLNLFCISGIATLLNKTCKNWPNADIMVLSILSTALFFGVAHIPVFVRPGTPDMLLVIMRLMVLNLFSGITFGYLFWKKSFEAAVFGHVVVDAILYVLIPLFSLMIP